MADFEGQGDECEWCGGPAHECSHDAFDEEDDDYYI
jgi:hypothetical protein